jgi:hypothetical protein
MIVPTGPGGQVAKYAAEEHVFAEASWMRLPRVIAIRPDALSAAEERIRS